MDRTVTIAALCISILTAADVDARWVEVAAVLPSAQAFVMPSPGVAIGFSADLKQAQLWSAEGGEGRTLARLTSQPPLYGYATNAEHSVLCFGQTAPEGVMLRCHDKRGRLVDRPRRLPVDMASGAIVRPGRLLVVNPDDQQGTWFVELEARGDGWLVAARHRSPFCREGQSSCGELEIHPLGANTVAVVQLHGRIDDKFHYPDVGIWDLASGKTWRQPVPALPIPKDLIDRYRTRMQQWPRLIYRSAMSPSRKVALIVELPNDLRSRPRRDQLWLYSPGAGWSKLLAPDSLTAVAFQGEAPVVITREGRMLRWEQ